MKASCCEPGSPSILASTDSPSNNGNLQTFSGWAGLRLVRALFGEAAGELEPRVQPELGVDVREVQLDRMNGDRERSGRFLVRAPGRNQLGDTLLRPCQHSLAGWAPAEPLERLLGFPLPQRRSELCEERGRRLE